MMVDVGFVDFFIHTLHQDEAAHTDILELGEEAFRQNFAPHLRKCIEEGEVDAESARTLIHEAADAGFIPEKYKTVPHMYAIPLLTKFLEPDVPLEVVAAWVEKVRS